MAWKAYGLVALWNVYIVKTDALIFDDDGISINDAGEKKKRVKGNIIYRLEPLQLSLQNAPPTVALTMVPVQQMALLRWIFDLIKGTDN